MTVISLGLSEPRLRATAASYELLTGWRGAGLVLLYSLVGCHAQAPETAGARGSRSSAPSPPPLARSADLAPEAARFWPLFCAKPEACLSEVWPAGQSSAGQTLSVVALDERAGGDRESSADPTPEAEVGPSRDHQCTEYWLVSEGLSQPGQRALASRQWLAETCLSHTWETFAEVDAEHRTLRYGGHSLFDLTRSFSTTTIGLDPVRLVETNEIVLGELSSDETWNWDEFAGTVISGIDYCLGKVPPGVEVPSDRDAPSLQVPAVAVPRLALPDDYLSGGWRTTELGTCAARVDGAQYGFDLSGSPGRAADRTLKLLLSTANELFVEITDDRLLADRSAFGHGEHLQLWLASPDSACVDPKAASALTEWRVRLSDGRAFAGFGRPSGALRTERAVAASGKTRFRIQLAEKLHADTRFSVVYADRAQGRSVKRAIATSALSSGSWWTLGKVTDIGSDPSTCLVSEGRLMASARAWSVSAASGPE
ncbi:MAG TPA: hypothetical protein VJV79_06290 [Polyangiaceae bacterium]|nr:hypothetical protein [Polyangiaceae bacterium]